LNEHLEKIMKMSERLGEKAAVYKMEPTVKKEKKEPIKDYKEYK
jgi:hypothetical protein